MAAAALSVLALGALACGDERVPAATGLRAPAEASGVTLPTTTARGREGALAGGVVDVPMGVRAQSGRYRLVNTGLTPGVTR